MSAAVRASVSSKARDLLRAAVAELDAIVAEGLVPGAADRLNGAAALIEEALSQIEGSG